MTIKNAAEKAMHLGKQLQAVVEVGKVLDEIGDLENAKVESERDARKAHEEFKQASEKRNLIRNSLAQSEKDLTFAKEKIKQTNAEATARHDHIIAEARKERDATLLAAKESSEQRVAKANQEVNALHDQRDKLLKEVTDVQAAVTALENQMKALKERLG